MCGSVDLRLEIVSTSSALLISTAMIVFPAAVAARGQIQGHDPSAARIRAFRAHHGYLMKHQSPISTAPGYSITDYSCAAQSKCPTELGAASLPDKPDTTRSVWAVTNLSIHWATG